MKVTRFPAIEKMPQGGKMVSVSGEMQVEYP
jgi:hypothetical protein